MPRLALCVVLLLLVAPAAAHGGAWQRPVDGPLLRPFAVGRDPYARGLHRGVDLAAARGSPVRSACSGRVGFAGRVPRGGLTVSVRCGALIATYQQLGAIAVRRGAPVGRGGRLGAVGSSSDPRERRPHVHLGAREAASGRYLDPLALLASASPGAPVLPPPARRAPPLGPAPLLPRLAPPRSLAPRGAPLPATEAPRPVAPGYEPRLPWSVWVGLACFGLGLPVGGFLRVRRRQRATRRAAQTA